MAADTQGGLASGVGGFDVRMGGSWGSCQGRKPRWNECGARRSTYLFIVHFSVLGDIVLQEGLEKLSCAFVSIAVLIVIPAVLKRVARFAQGKGWLLFLFPLKVRNHGPALSSSSTAASYLQAWIVMDQRPVAV